VLNSGSLRLPLPSQSSPFHYAGQSAHAAKDSATAANEQARADLLQQEVA
jgi:hypothetical protein